MPREASLRGVTITDDQSLVVAWGCSAVQCARLKDAIRGAGQLRVARETSELFFRGDDGLRAPDVLVLAVAGDSARDVVAITRELRVRCPRAALVAYSGGVRDTPASIGALAAAGVHQFVFTDVNDHGAVLRTILESARQQCAAEVVMAALRPLVPPPIHPLVEAALTRPLVVIDVRSLADAIGVHRKTVFNRCAHAEFLNPVELLTWTRLALVAYLLEVTGITVEKISIETGYPSPTALRNMMKRYTGLRPTEIRAGGGLQVVVDRLRVRLAPTSAGLSAESAVAAPLHTV
jgi:AraC-like DNA-binding protein